MDNDAVLTQAEQRKADADPVWQAQKELAPVRAWAVKGKKDFLAEAATFRPRINRALNEVNRLTALLGTPQHNLLRLWQELDKIVDGIPQEYQNIINGIDRLTLWAAAQPNYMEPLRQKHKNPPGTIGTLVEALERLEYALGESVAALQTAQ